jgi:predicted DNA-binding protein
MSSNETEEIFYEELSIIINELIEMGKENTPKEFKDKLNQLIELLNKLREYYIKNKKAIDDFLNGGEDFIEEQKKIVDDGTVKRERGNYNPDKILNNFKYDLIMIIFIVILLIVLIYIAKNNFDKLILKKKIELQLSSLSGLNENNENNNKNNNNENNLNNNKNDNENNIYKNDINYLNEPLI